MDDRRQGIADLRKRMEDYARALNGASEKLGAEALSDARGRTLLSESINEEKRLERDLAEARSVAKSIEGDTARLHALRLAEQNKQREAETLRRNLFELQARLGEAALGSSIPPAAFSPFRERIGAVAVRIEEMDSRLAELENATDDGLIAHLGRSAQSAILRSSQAARRAEGRRILAEAGAALALTDEVLSSEDDTVRAGAAELIAHGEAAARLEEDLGNIRNEIKELTSRLATGSAAGNPRRAVAHAEKTIAEGEAGLAALHKEVGKRLLDAAEGEGGGGRRKDPFAVFAAEFLSEPGVAEIISKARSCAASIVAAKRQIEKIEASIKIDVLLAELTKLRGAVADHERRIASSTRALEDLALRIADAEHKVASLRDLHKTS